ncbi:MAG TPA: HlyD family efflux transporter periplasmic adaptor subunit [Xanthobacteraceae bacterium]|nr:HlyD family efflux transporter periplasmic adaptor subunit [Xanthobacteraceae bacterium]
MNVQTPDLEDQSAAHPAIEPAIASAPVPSAGARLPSVRAVRSRRLDRRRVVQVVAIAIVGTLGIFAGIYAWKQAQTRLPAGIAFSNGRIEADEIDIDTKFAGRIAELMADEGDMVKAGQVVARMDTRDLQQSLERVQAQARQAQRALDEARANVQQQQALVTLAGQQMDRAQALLKSGWITKETFDQRQQVLDGANAGLTAANAKAAQAEHALEATQHDIGLYQVNIADNTLVAPRDGRIQYRIANIGEVLPAGGKVFTMLDIADVYMDIYLPTQEVGKIRIGSDARIVLDAYPNLAIPAKVSFIATQAQFTPKTVETQSERDKLMFRVRVRIDPDLLRRHAESVRSGLPGLAYVRADPAVAWPERLQGTIAQ